MPISVHHDGRIFKLDAGNVTYTFGVIGNGYLAHFYYGKRTSQTNMSYLIAHQDVAFSGQPAGMDDRMFSLDTIPLEYSGTATGDYRETSISAEGADGCAICDLRYDSYDLSDGKPTLEGLPSSWTDSKEKCKTLIIHMLDKIHLLSVDLIYTVFHDYNVITRSVVVKNLGTDSINLKHVLSACIDFNRKDMDMLTLHGAWGRERNAQRFPMHHGKQTIDSIRGASSHQHNPFVALMDHTASEAAGEVYAFALVYSGNFVAQAEVSQLDVTRFTIGINPYGFNWLLDPGESFTAPEAVMVYSDSGLQQITHTFHDFYKKHLVRSKFRDVKRPILVNTWDATYFDFDTNKIILIAKEAAAVGIEMLVMDDGWFGKRDSDTSGLGDWVVNEKKLSGGLKSLVAQVNELGLKFGIWVEPEMVSEDSELYRANKDWTLHIPNRSSGTCRSQLVLDMSRGDVRDYLFNALSQVFSSANIEYVKWDMNRHIIEAGSAKLPKNRQHEVWHRYILGVYNLMDRLVTAFPDILFESCSGGGGRFDAGMMYYMPQAWCSDDSDAIERLRIQYGTLMAYPVTMLGAHVSDIPNSLTGRVTPLETRGRVAMTGSFGYELDLTQLSAEEKEIIKTQISDFHKYSGLIRTGDYYRLSNPFENADYTAWMFSAKDKSEALVTYVKTNATPNMLPSIVRLYGLSPEWNYIDDNNNIFTGNALMNAGYKMPLIQREYDSLCIYLKHVI